jgi:hypothetical protein
LALRHLDDTPALLGKKKGGSERTTQKERLRGKFYSTPLGKSTIAKKETESMG